MVCKADFLRLIFTCRKPSSFSPLEALSIITSICFLGPVSWLSSGGKCAVSWSWMFHAQIRQSSFDSQDLFWVFDNPMLMVHVHYSVFINELPQFSCGKDWTLGLCKKVGKTGALLTDSLWNMLEAVQYFVLLRFLLWAQRIQHVPVSGEWYSFLFLHADFISFFQVQRAMDSTPSNIQHTSQDWNPLLLKQFLVW